MSEKQTKKLVRVLDLKNEIDRLECVVCGSCGQRYTSIPLSGQCIECGGELFFQLGKTKVRRKSRPEELELEKMVDEILRLRR